MPTNDSPSSICEDLGILDKQAFMLKFKFVSRAISSTDEQSSIFMKILSNYEELLLINSFVYF